MGHRYGVTLPAPTQPRACGSGEVKGGEVSFVGRQEYLASAISP